MKAFKSRVSKLFRRKKACKTLEDSTTKSSSSGIRRRESSSECQTCECDTTCVENTCPVAEEGEEEEQVGVEEVVDTWMTMEEIQAVHVSLGRMNKEDRESPTTAGVLTAEARVATTKEFINRVNQHDNARAGELVTGDNHWHFYNLSRQLDAELSWTCWAQEHENINASFPDFKFHYEKAVPISCCSLRSGACAVVLQGFRASGTHTGAPYAFGPCEPIESTGKAVLNDPEEVYFFFRQAQDKIARIIVCPRGQMTGPPGLYTQIGGFPMM